MRKLRNLVDIETAIELEKGVAYHTVALRITLMKKTVPERVEVVKESRKGDHRSGCAMTAKHLSDQHTITC